jgi:hypothetical protein
MPDELLNGTASSVGKRAGVFEDQANGESEAEHTEHEEELSFEPASDTFAHQNFRQEKHFPETPESNRFEDLAESVSQIDEELRGFNSSKRSPEVEDDSANRYGEAHYSEAEKHSENAVENAGSPDLLGSPPAWELEQRSPFETEIDPVTGIYRLKNKTNSADVAEDKEDEAEEHDQEASGNLPTWHSDSSEEGEDASKESNAVTDEETVIVLPASQEPEDNDSSDHYQQLKLSSVNDQHEEQE